jgi:hypothetical protein
VEDVTVEMEVAAVVGLAVADVDKAGVSPHEVASAISVRRTGKIRVVVTARF